jgi:hypothetical protein
MRLITLFALLVVVLLAGCVPLTKEPLYNPDDLLFEKALVGDYREGPEQTVFLKEGPGQSYLQGHVGEQGVPVRLLKLGDHYFMDEDSGTPGQHFFFKVGVVGQEVRVWTMSVPWLKTLVEKDPKAVAYEIKREVVKEGDKDVERDTFILTGPTKDLQAFVRGFVDTPEAWRGPFIYKAKFELPVKDMGLLSKKQQTFECWFEFRTIVRNLAADPLADPVNVVTKAAEDLGSLGGDGIDPEAAAVAKKASQALQKVADQVRKGEEARPLIKAFLKETAGPAREAATKLSGRYSLKFGVID